MKKRILLVPVAAVMFASCASNDNQETQTVQHTVVLTQPATKGLAKEKEFSGIVKEAREINFGFKTAGQLEKIHVKDGDYVKEGQLVAELDSKDYQLALNATQIQYDQTSRQVERLKKLREGKSVSVNDYDKAVSGLEQLAIQLQNEKNRVSYTKLYAPANGYIQKVNFEKSEMVDAGTPVMTLLETSKLNVEVNIPAELYLQKNKIKKIYCKTSVGKETTLPMKIESMTPKADGNQLYQMKLAFAKTPGKEITSGMNISVVVEMTEGSAKSEYTIPLHSIFKSGDDDCIWILNSDSTLQKKIIKMNKLDDNGDAIIESGLNGNENIVKAGVTYLQEGEKVKVVSKASTTNVGGLK